MTKKQRKIIDYILKFNKEFYYPIKQGIKESTIRKNSKPMNEGDYVVAYFPELEQGLLLKIVEHYAKKLNELGDIEAKCEGYYHADLLKHTMRCIYSDLDDGDYVYFYKFVRIREHGAISEVNDFLSEKELKE